MNFYNNYIQTSNIVISITSKNVNNLLLNDCILI